MLAPALSLVSMCDEVLPVYLCEYGVINKEIFDKFSSELHGEAVEGERIQVILEKMKKLGDGQLQPLNDLVTDIRAVIALGYYNGRVLAKNIKSEGKGGRN